MSACCISGCKNRHSLNSKLKFYRIPSGYRTFQANRRRLWLQAIQQVNGSTEELKGNVRVCSAHFISGEASMDFDSPDFVPSVFNCIKQNPKRKWKWFTGRRKSRRRTVKDKTQEKTTPPRAVSPADPQSSDVIEETQKPSSLSVPEVGEALTKESEDETETMTIEPKAASSPNEASPSFKVPASTQKLDKGIPTVPLKPVFTQARGYQCELCNQNFTTASQLLKHTQLHVEEKSSNSETGGELFTSQADFTEQELVDEPSFPCNMCDRCFTTSHQLKRHKLLHVKDGRKCPMCGVLFCQRHNHILFLPQSESEENDSFIETENNLEKPNHTTEVDDDAQSTVTFTPLQTMSAQTVLPAPRNPGSVCKTLKPLPPASHLRVLSEMPVPVLIKPSSAPDSIVPKYSRNPGISSQFKPPLPFYPATSSQQNLPKDIELPPSLQMFSPKFLTSAFFEVKRNYEYILSKPRGVKKEMEEKQQAVPQHVEQDKEELSAFNLDVVF